MREGWEAGDKGKISKHCISFCNRTRSSVSLNLLFDARPCHRPLSDLLPTIGVGRGTWRSEFPTSRTLYSQFPPPPLVVPACVCFFYRETVSQCYKIHFLFLLAFAPLRYPISRTLFSSLPYTYRPHYSRIPAPLSSSTLYVKRTCCNAQ